MSNPEPEEVSSHGPPSRRRGISRLAVLVTSLSVVLAFGVGLVVGWQVFDRSDSPPSDAEMACTLAEQLPTNLRRSVQNSEDPLSGPLFPRITSLGTLAMAAGRSEERLSALEEPGKQVRMGIMRVQLDTVVEAVKTIRSECDDLGL